MRSTIVLLASLALAACSTDPRDDSADAGPDAGPVEVPFCESTTKVVYDPLSKAAGAFPDDYFTVDDALNPTGLKLRFTADQFTVPANLQQFSNVFTELGALDGFGTTAPLTMRFNARLDPATLPVSGDGSGTRDASVLVVRLDSTELEFVDAEFELVSETQNDPSQTLVVSPMKPLAAKAKYALVVTHKLHDEAAGCIAPSDTMKGLIENTSSDVRLVRLHANYLNLVTKLKAAGVITSKGQLSAAVVFTTQHTVDDSATIARSIRARTYSYDAAGCVAEQGTRRCQGSFTASDFRLNGSYIDDKSLTPKASYQLNVTVWLPETGVGPFKTVIFGHGLGGDRTQAAGLAPAIAAKGFAIIAIDAPKHGAHPDQAGVSQLTPAPVAFFGAELVGFSVKIDSRKFRDNLRQATYDKLQLVEALRAGIDADEDGTRETTINDLVYMGLSLGGIMAPEFAAFTPELEAVVAIVPGARLAYVLRDSSSFASARQFVLGSATAGDLARFFPVMQTALDRGDPGAYGPHILGARLSAFDGHKPQFLMQMVIDDDTVPNSTNRFFARSLGLPHLGEELQKIGAVPHVAAMPVKENLAAGLTAGVFQFDVVAGGAATHNNLAGSSVWAEQTEHFLDSWFASGKAEILDPYKTLGIKP